MPTKIFSLAATSFELRCQCPLVTPASLNGNGCAAAALTARTVDASKKLANNVVFINPSVLHRYAVAPAFASSLPSPAAGRGREGRLTMNATSLRQSAKAWPPAWSGRGRAAPTPSLRQSEGIGASTKVTTWGAQAASCNIARVGATLVV